MAYNKARAERIWKQWKQSEECELQRFNASEDLIKELRNYDWEMFNAERRYRQREITSSISFDNIPALHKPELIITLYDFLNDIESSSLYNFLVNTDITTLKIVILRLNEYSVPEISRILQLSHKSIYRRLDRFKIKLKKFFNS